MNNKAHLRPNDYDKNGDIIPDSVREEKGDLISRSALKETTIQEYCKKHCALPNSEEYCSAFCPCRFFLNLIDSASTVEPSKTDYLDGWDGEYYGEDC